MDHGTPSSGPGVPPSHTWPGSGPGRWDSWREEVHRVRRCLEHGSSSQTGAQLSPSAHFMDGQPKAEAELGGGPEVCVPLKTTAVWTQHGWHSHPAPLAPGTWHLRPLSPRSHPHTDAQAPLGPQRTAGAERSGTCFPPSLGSIPSLLRARRPETKGSELMSLQAVTICPIPLTHTCAHTYARRCAQAHTCPPTRHRCAC